LTSDEVRGMIAPPVLERSNTSGDDAARFLARLAGAPISWGVCEVPGWGTTLPPEVVLADMRSLGLTATELGPDGWLPTDVGALRELLDAHGLRLVAGFVPLVLHQPDHADGAREAAARAARLLSGAGGRVLVSAAVASASWSPRTALGREEWKRLGEGLDLVGEIAGDHGLAHALHPHIGTLVEDGADLERVAEVADVRWCLDTGHLAGVGVDPVRLARDEAARIAHVHLKDVDLPLAGEVRSGAVSLSEATRRGLFQPLGRGDVAVGEVIGALEGSGYDGWYVLEQDVVLTGSDAVGGSPAQGVGASLEYVRTLVSEAPAPEAQHQGKPHPHDAGREHEEVA
jgi:inosose dehydratase